MRTGFIFLLLATCSAASEWPDRVLELPTQVPSYTICRVTDGIVIDGKENEADWRAAAPIQLIFPWNDVKTESVQQTVARMLWDDARLYIIYVCDDPYIGAEIVEHDGPTYREDAVEVFATPNPHDVNQYFGYEMNARGTLLDYVTFWRDGKRQSGGRSWQSEGVKIATTINGTLNDDSDIDAGWVLEIAIPFDNFRHQGGRIPPQDGDMWRLNLNRCAGKTRGQYSVWSDTGAPKPSFHHPEYFGKVFFLDSPVQGESNE